ncbi:MULTISPECIES: hypothetical protein [Streptomyces]|uniref:hypothetical protein n=1 Tax=Streptomyces TaxID=1883 RepID=UPI001FE3812D|nr:MULTISPECIES: hypothetical protein [Streptomyces]MDF3148567.1 hypothetical protein [Streptomyces sp. T21Q-yed]WDF38340.1 hypothetical protein PBV52_16805 [Streptomyces sp. T12]
METSQSVVPRTPSTTAGHAPTAEFSEPPEVGCDVVTVPARQGLEAVDILRRGAGDGVGPVLHDDGGDTLGFVVPPGTAAAWDVPGSTCTETDGRGLSLNLNPEPPVEGSDWLLPPGEADLATDPAVLRAALGEAARLIEAADNCR